MVARLGMEYHQVATFRRSGTTAIFTFRGPECYANASRMETLAVEGRWAISQHADVRALLNSLPAHTTTRQPCLPQLRCPRLPIAQDDNVWQSDNAIYSLLTAGQPSNLVFTWLTPWNITSVNDKTELAMMLCNDPEYNATNVHVLPAGIMLTHKTKEAAYEDEASLVALMENPASHMGSYDITHLPQDFVFIPLTSAITTSAITTFCVTPSEEDHSAFTTPATSDAEDPGEESEQESDNNAAAGNLQPQEGQPPEDVSAGAAGSPAAAEQGNEMREGPRSTSPQLSRRL
jgi:hypothetical protein